MTNPQQPEPWSDPTWQLQQPGYPDPGQPPGYPGPGQQLGYPDPGQQVSGQPFGDQPTSVAGQPVPAYPPYGYPPMPLGQPTNGMAIAALVLSLVGIASCITAPIGAVLGHVARRQIRERGEGGDGMALAAIIVGWIFTGLLVLVIVFYIVMIVLAIRLDSSGGS